MIVRTDLETDDCTIALGAHEVIELYGGLCELRAAGGEALELRQKLLEWIENELVFDNQNNPNRQRSA